MIDLLQLVAMGISGGSRRPVLLLSGVLVKDRLLKYKFLSEIIIYNTFII